MYSRYVCFSSNTRFGNLIYIGRCEENMFPPVYAVRGFKNYLTQWVSVQYHNRALEGMENVMQKFDQSSFFPTTRSRFFNVSTFAVTFY